MSLPIWGDNIVNQYTAGELLCAFLLLFPHKTLIEMKFNYYQVNKQL